MQRWFPAPLGSQILGKAPPVGLKVDSTPEIRHHGALGARRVCELMANAGCNPSSWSATPAQQNLVTESQTPPSPRSSLRSYWFRVEVRRQK